MRRSETFERIQAVEREFWAANEALAGLLEIVRLDPTRLHNPSIAPADVHGCYRNLEATYCLRIYAEFESAMRDYWLGGLRRPTEPPMRDLLEATAAARPIPEATLRRAHEAREYRNALVHTGVTAQPMTLAQLRSALCSYLAFLPLEW